MNDRANSGGAPSKWRERYGKYVEKVLEVLFTGALLIAYGLYTFTAEGLPENHSMMLTIPFVLYGIFRYMYLVNVKNEGGSPEEVLLKDVPIMLTIAGWVATAGIILILARE